jgi:hypothetical protein
MKRSLAVAALLLLGGCASFEVTGPGNGPVLDFSVRAASDHQFLEPVVTAEGQDGRIVVAARISTPDPCRRITGSLDAAGTELTVRVSVQRSSSEACIQVIGTFVYDAVVR